MAELQVGQREGELIVSNGVFVAVYFRRRGEPELVLRCRTSTNDNELLARAWQVAISKARELGWIA
jgi:hypothetical protein